METQAWNRLARRLDLLERERRQSLWVAAAFFCGVMVLLVGGFAPIRRPKVLEAERIVLKDRDGRARALLQTAPDGSPMLALLDGQGRHQIILHGAADESASMELNGDGQTRVALTATRDGAALLNFFDRAGRSGTGMFLHPDSTVGLEMRQGERGVLMAAQPDGLAGLAVAGPDGRPSGQLGPLPDGVRLRAARWSYNKPPFEPPGPERDRQRIAGPPRPRSQGELHPAPQGL